MRIKKHKRSKFLFKEEGYALRDVQRKVKKDAAKLEKRHTATEWIFIQRLED
jgi:hypothetical protein